MRITGRAADLLQAAGMTSGGIALAGRGFEEAERAWVRMDGAGDKQRELDVVSSRERKRIVGFLVDDGSYEGVLGLKQLGREDVAMQISKSVGPDWTNWTRDPIAIESARKKLGETIDQIMTKSPAAAAATRSSGN